MQTLALALHELATNARKHGALSHDRGRIAVTWRETVKDGEHRLALGLEQTPERPASTVTSGGYGRELIEQALPHAMGARTSYALTPSGVRCTIEEPGSFELTRGQVVMTESHDSMTGSGFSLPSMSISSLRTWCAISGRRAAMSSDPSRR